ncbi:MAG: NAD(P)H-hydrate dehydratase [Kiritimatiellae bacterium]|nr:NAD(P)H-hydrate dehydratase [Kiritimatiellia bacterium]
MKVITAEQMREFDRRMIEQFVSGDVLMERAGAGLAQAVLRRMRRVGVERFSVLLVAGKGNNGGDACVAARHLKDAGHAVQVLLTGPGEALVGDARTHFDRMVSEGVRWSDVPEDGWLELGVSLAGKFDVIVDGVLGTGVQGAARGVAIEAIDAINVLGKRALVVAIDIPSGLGANDGAVEGRVVRADLTVTMAFPKRGLVQPSAVEFVGDVEVVDIGIPSSFSASVDSNLELITPADLEWFPVKRCRNTHKGSYGHVLLIGGSPGMSGAMVMAARAALRSGAGLVSVLTPASVASIVAGAVPEAMVHAAAQEEDGTLCVKCVEEWGRNLADFDGILIGPGMRVTRATTTLTERVLAGSRSPLVLDADALNACANRMFLIKRARCPVILTPHPGEMGRLFNGSIEAVQKDRLGATRKAAETTRAVVVLKGAGTVITEHEAQLWVNMTGNPGMATGGMGDVLAGFLTGLAAQSFAPLDAARLAVYLHGMAGDLAATRLSESALTATDVIAALPEAFKRLTVRR